MRQQWTRTEITINGKTYNSVDEIPPDVRAEYAKTLELLADKDGNGIPDIAEDGQSREIEFTNLTSTTHTFGDQAPNRVIISLPTLLAPLATVAVIGGALVWYWMR